MTNATPPDRPESRLDREVDEILNEARKRPISFQDRVAQKKAAVHIRKQAPIQRMRSVGNGLLGTIGRLMLRVPLVTALALALIAVWLPSEYNTVAVLMALAAAILIFVPYVMRRPTAQPTYQKRWRGRTVEPSRSPMSGTGLPQTVRSWVDSARNRLGR